MKRKGNLMGSIAAMDNLYRAWIKARRGKHQKLDVLAFESQLDKNLRKLQFQLLEVNVQVGDYHYFMIFDPKERQICAAPFSERVLHHALMNICHDSFEKHLIGDTYATRKNRGTYAALDRARSFSKKYQWFVKMDVRKYFDSINHVVLGSQLSQMFKDKDLLKVFDQILGSYSTDEGKGVPIGNLTSQYFANHYLSGADHFAKEQLGVKGYIRYMDDVLMFGNNKGQLLGAAKKFVDYLRTYLKLELKPLVHAKTSFGIPFLGYKVFPYQVRLNKRSKARFRKKVKEYHDNLTIGVWDESAYQMHILPLLAFVEYADTLKYRKKIFWDKSHRL
ncbi:MAG TPA: RNA-directed DNA polymerase [Saprospiraceae bacterium]|nr:RNA-directed DNA polymerase [Saprospiraceae bacterium]